MNGTNLLLLPENNIHFFARYVDIPISAEIVRQFGRELRRVKYFYVALVNPSRLINDADPQKYFPARGEIVAEYFLKCRYRHGWRNQFHRLEVDRKFFIPQPSKDVYFLFLTDEPYAPQELYPLDLHRLLTEIEDTAYKKIFEDLPGVMHKFHAQADFPIAQTNDEIVQR